MKQKATIEYGIIGLGTFGSALAKKLSHAGKEVLALDQSEDRVDEIKDYVDTCFVVKSLDRSVLEGTGIQNCETVIIGISKDIAMSVLTTLNIINMGVPRVIAKAHSDDHGMILEKLGASVVYPERDMAERIGGMLLNSRKLDFINLNGDVSISEFKIPKSFVGQSIRELNIRERFSLSIIAVESEGETVTRLHPSRILKDNDYIVVVGDNEDILNFEKTFND